MTYGNMREFAFDTYASHVVRSLILLLGGCDLADAYLRSGVSQRNRDKRQPPPGQRQQQQLSGAGLTLDAALKAKYKPMLEQFCSKCLSLGMADMAHNHVASPVLQAALKALKCQKSVMADAAVERVVAECRLFDADDVDASAVPPALDRSAGLCRLAEEALTASSKTRLKSLYKHRLRGRLAALARNPGAAISRVWDPWKVLCESPCVVGENLRRRRVQFLLDRAALS